MSDDARSVGVQSKRELFDRVVKELSLDTRDPFTLLFANACALADQVDALKALRDSKGCRRGN